MREPLCRADFFETSNGHCRLVSQLCAKLAETSATWNKLVALWAELVARRLWDSISPSNNGRRLPTRLTQRHLREAKGHPPARRISSPSTKNMSQLRSDAYQEASGLLPTVRCGNLTREYDRNGTARPGSLREQPRIEGTIGCFAETAEGCETRVAHFKPSDVAHTIPLS